MTRKNNNGVNMKTTTGTADSEAAARMVQLDFSEVETRHAAKMVSTPLPEIWRGYVAALEEENAKLRAENGVLKTTLKRTANLAMLNLLLCAAAVYLLVA